MDLIAEPNIHHVPTWLTLYVIERGEIIFAGSLDDAQRPTAYASEEPRDEQSAPSADLGGRLARQAQLVVHGLVKAHEAGEAGAGDLEEMFDDAADTAIRDMERANIDVITDGEVRRLDGYVDSYYAIIKGIQPLPVRRQVGPWGYDQQTRYEAVGRIETPAGGLGIVKEFEYLKSHTGRATKATCAGPLTFGSRIHPGKQYKGVVDVAERFAEVINAELKALVAPGADWIQLDEPARGNVSGEEMARLFNLATEGVKARLGLPHLLRQPLRPVALPAHATSRTSRVSCRLARRSVRPGVRQPRAERGGPLAEVRERARAGRRRRGREGLSRGDRGQRGAADPSVLQARSAEKLDPESRLRLRLVAALHVQPEAASVWRPGRRWCERS